MRKASRSKPAILRLTFTAPAAPAVFAKRFHPAGLALERRIYETILPRLPVTVARYRGACEDDDGSAWMFVEDVGDRCMSPADPEHQVLAARWLGLLHRSAAEVVAAEPLPDAGPGRYLAHLRAARDDIRRHFGNRGLTPADREVLGAVLAQGDALESRWPQIERACEGFPVTLVHADFQPKNVRIRNTDAGPVLCPIDWETAGRGVPAADLARSSSRGLVMQIDPQVYESTVRECWPHLEAASIRRLKGDRRGQVPLAAVVPPIADLERARMLASLAVVHHVVPFDGQTLTLLERLRPDVLVKGADYELSGVVGRRLVESWGGRVELAPLLPGVSTSSLSGGTSREMVHPTPSVGG